MHDTSQSATHVQCRDVRKSFGPVEALRGANLQLTSGRISALVGENGAGKSTLMKVIAGDITPDAGNVEVSARVGLVHQQLSTIAELTVVENVVFGAERSAGPRNAALRALGGISWRAHRAAVAELMDRTGIVVPLSKRAGEVPVGVRQRVDILAALYRGARCLLLDEPTTYLTPHEVDKLFEVMRDLVDNGMSVVFISHRLREVAQHCDEVNVLRRGESVLRLPTGPFDLGQVGRAMTGGDDAASAPAAVRRKPAGQTLRLRVGGQLQVHAGEIVGIAGVSGNGQGELLDAIAGLAHDRQFTPIVIDGVDVTKHSPACRRTGGLRFIPESVKESGAAMMLSITDNVLTAIPAPEFRGRFGVLHRARSERRARELLATANVVANGPRQRVGELSGGNLQRVAVARELAGTPGVLLAHEPTRGVDFAGVGSIHAQVLDFAERGGAVLLLTSDIDELFALSDRIHVIDRGRLGRSFDRSELTYGSLGELLGGLDTEAV